MRILLHPGFHKTGTSSLQRGVQKNMGQLAAHLRFLNTSDVIEAARAARRFSAYPESDHLRRFAEEFSAALAQVEATEASALLISSEDFSGYIPGHHDVDAYDAAPPLMNVATACLRASFGETADITIWYTTRAPDAWKRSAYFQNLRALRITESFEDYSPRLERAARLIEIVAAVKARLRDTASVRMSAVEDFVDTPLGPLGEALDILGIPADGLQPVPVHNRQPDGAADALLALNRSDLSDAALADAKRAVLKDLRAGKTPFGTDTGQTD